MFESYSEAMLLFDLPSYPMYFVQLSSSRKHSQLISFRFAEYSMYKVQMIYRRDTYLDFLDLMSIWLHTDDNLECISAANCMDYLVNPNNNKQIVL